MIYLLNFNQALALLDTVLASARAIIRNIPENILHLILSHWWRILLLFVFYLQSLFIQLSFVKNRAEALVFTPFSSEHLNKRLFFVECWVVMEYRFILVLRYSLSDLSQFLNFLLLIKKIEDSLLVRHQFFNWHSFEVVTVPNLHGCIFSTQWWALLVK